MPRVINTLRALTDLDSIWDHIANDNPVAADRVIERIGERCDLLAHQPLSGTAHPDFADALRFVSIGSYVLFYKPLHDGIRVIRVLHGARDVPATLFDDMGDDEEP